MDKFLHVEISVVVQAEPKKTKKRNIRVEISVVVQASSQAGLVELRSIISEVFL